MFSTASIAAGLNKNAKIFTDTVTMRLRYDNGPNNNTDVFPTFPREHQQPVRLPAQHPAAATSVFNYTSFQTAPATTNTAYARALHHGRDLHDGAGCDDGNTASTSITAWR